MAENSALKRQLNNKALASFETELNKRDDRIIRPVITTHTQQQLYNDNIMTAYRIRMLPDNLLFIPDNIPTI